VGKRANLGAIKVRIWDRFGGDADEMRGRECNRVYSRVWLVFWDALEQKRKITRND
jgi:hypothetical protein